MVNIDKIKKLSKEHGLSLSFICKKIGVARVYFNDIQNSGRDIPDDRLSLIADLLDTTIEYLRDESDIKEEQPLEFPDNIPESNKELYSLVKQVPPERRQEALTYLRYLIDSSGK